MREIKFRGKSLKYGNWIFGCLWVDGEDFYIIQEIREEKAGENSPYETFVTKVDPSTVGQYIGLKDKSGKEIYEGDIVKGIYDYIHIIKYNKQRVSFTAMSPKSILRDDFHITQEWINECEKEVIGNIHDNPGLIEQ